MEAEPKVATSLAFLHHLIRLLSSHVLASEQLLSVGVHAGVQIPILLFGFLCSTAQFALKHEIMSLAVPPPVLTSFHSPF